MPFAQLENVALLSGGRSCYDDEEGRSSPAKNMLSNDNVNIVRMILDAYPNGALETSACGFDS